MSSFQGWLEYTEISHFRVLEKRDFTVYRDVLISGGWNRGVLLYIEMSSFHGGWNRGVLLYTEMSSFQGVGIEGFYCI